MSTATQAQNVGPVGPYGTAGSGGALDAINQEWSGSGGKGTPNVAARIEIAMALAGIAPLQNMNSFKNLIAQSNLEYPSGPVGNNLMGTSLQVDGSTSTNGDGVQAYSTWQAGVYALTSMLEQQNMAPMYTALYKNASPQDYANALAGSNWEGSDPGANQAYAQSFLGRFNQLNANGTLDSLIKAAGASDPAVLSGAGQEGGVTPGLGVPDPLSALGTFVGDLLSGFGIGWKAVLTIIGGILLIGVGVLVIFRRQTAQVAESTALA